MAAVAMDVSLLGKTQLFPFEGLFLFRGLIDDLS
jgi:hypothetical protein